MTSLNQCCNCCWESHLTSERYLRDRQDCSTLAGLAMCLVIGLVLIGLGSLDGLALSLGTLSSSPALLMVSRSTLGWLDMWQLVASAAAMQMQIGKHKGLYTYRDNVRNHAVEEINGKKITVKILMLACLDVEQDQVIGFILPEHVSNATPQIAKPTSLISPAGKYLNLSEENVDEIPEIQTMLSV
ncbi:hypothetical protein JOM56_013015 [Amanita muscaria]